MTTSTTHIEKRFLTSNEDLWSAAVGFQQLHEFVGDRELLGIEASLSLGDGDSTALLDLSVWAEPGLTDLKAFNAQADANLGALDALSAMVSDLRTRYALAVSQVNEEVTSR